MAVVYWIHLNDQTDIFTQGYVGVSIKPKQRWRCHFSAAKLEKHDNPHLQRAILKYKNIVSDVLLEGTEKYCYEIESLLRPTSLIGWNLLQGGSGGNRSGYIESYITRERKRIAHTGLKHSSEQCRNISLGQIGINRKESGKGRKFTEEHRRKISEAKKGCVPWNKGKKQNG